MIRKRTYSIMVVALLMAGTLLTTACSSEDEVAVNINEPKTVIFTATLAPKGGATTRAITVENQGAANETLSTAWEEGEKISVRVTIYVNTLKSVTLPLFKDVTQK